ncbi:MAG: ATP-binding cassette domain-containing protein, partial [Nitriliruptorales bacterium]|nr:ATP-binding cassette domain-containing protein [Nitriliruptorales bacterium]
MSTPLPHPRTETPDGYAPAREVLRRPTLATEVPSFDNPVFALSGVSVHYRDFQAVRDIGFQIPANEITALIGPSGCGKSTLLRCLNRMNDLIPSARVSGAITYHGVDLYAANVDPVEVRRRIGMVFQKPNPFPKSIYDNVAFGPRLMGDTRDLDDRVEQSLKGAALWDEVKDS